MRQPVPCGCLRARDPSVEGEPELGADLAEAHAFDQAVVKRGADLLDDRADRAVVRAGMAGEQRLESGGVLLGEVEEAADRLDDAGRAAGRSCGGSSSASISSAAVRIAAT